MAANFAFASDVALANKLPVKFNAASLSAISPEAVRAYCKFF
jgi:hypothetical protein